MQRPARYVELRIFSIYLPIYPPVYQSIHPSIYLSLSMYKDIYIYMYLHLSVCLPVHLSTYVLFIIPCICVHIYIREICAGVAYVYMCMYIHFYVYTPPKIHLESSVCPALCRYRSIEHLIQCTLTVGVVISLAISEFQSTDKQNNEN